MRIAAVQAESCWLDLDAGVEKTCNLIKEAGEKGCDLIGFPVSPPLLGLPPLISDVP